MLSTQFFILLAFYMFTFNHFRSDKLFIKVVLNTFFFSLQNINQSECTQNTERCTIFTIFNISFEEYTNFDQKEEKKQRRNPLYIHSFIIKKCMLVLGTWNKRWAIVNINNVSWQNYIILSLIIWVLLRVLHVAKQCSCVLPFFYTLQFKNDHMMLLSFICTHSIIWADKCAARC